MLLRYLTLTRNLKQCSLHINRRYYSVGRSFASFGNTLRRSYIYVPSGNERMLAKSLDVGSDVVIYDLEDSVSPSQEDKANARANLKAFLNEADPSPLTGSQIAVRVNDVSTPYFAEDIREILSNLKVKAVVLPKIHCAEDLDILSDALQQAPLAEVRAVPVEIIPSLESARGLWNLRDIAAWKSKHEPRLGGELRALMFACEDYCADTGIIRTPSRNELLYTRSRIVLAAKAHGLDAIDMVCIQYKDKDYLKGESVEGRQLGFTGKQAIHPSQVPIINSTFVPTSEEILRAAKILKGMKEAHASEKGAIGLEGEMIDAPMLKQAEKIIATAEAAGLVVPVV
ncbi:beta subunit of citrate lyase [Coprinopsis marcescibilis]|uniref:Beta subunit of citrate lyase n=1 Tax=Coprinopsis marcescibilis TaxID=230819 RepID=A0A5C3KID4_COPMA|nr:beta subunit of citrate lyase [Coprinopsis marcescibilis]